MKAIVLPLAIFYMLRAYQTIKKIQRYNMITNYICQRLSLYRAGADMCNLGHWTVGLGEV